MSDSADNTPVPDTTPETAATDTLAPASGDLSQLLGAPPPVVTKDQSHYLPIVIITAIFGALFIILPFLVRKRPNKGLLRCCIMLTLFCMWIFWVTIYIGNMNPLLGPRMRNTTIAWMAYKIGDLHRPPVVIVNVTEADNITTTTHFVYTEDDLIKKAY